MKLYSWFGKDELVLILHSNMNEYGL